MTDFAYQDPFPLGPDSTTYRKLSGDGVSTFTANGHTFLQVEPLGADHLDASCIHAFHISCSP